MKYVASVLYLYNCIYIAMDLDLLLNRFINSNKYFFFVTDTIE